MLLLIFVMYLRTITYPTVVAMAPGAIAASAQDRLVGLWSGTRSSSKTAATTATTTATATATATAAACDALQLNVLSSQTLRQMSLSPRPRDSWSRLESLLRRLCSAGLITPLVLEGQCLALTRMEWNPVRKTCSSRPRVRPD